MTTVPAVQTAGLGRRYGRHWALAHVDLAVEPGSAVLLAGPNGSGKTTLLRLVSGLEKATRGTLRVFGHDPVTERSTCRSRLSMVSHHSYLYGRLTALETVRLWCRLVGRPTNDDSLRKMLVEVGLDERADVPVDGFSAGMRKRLSLLRTRVEEPELVLLDEPFSALDAEGRNLVEGWVESFRAAGKTVIIASHDVARVARMCDRAVIFERGQVTWSGAAERAEAHVAESPQVHAELVQSERANADFGATE